MRRVILLTFCLLCSIFVNGQSQSPKIETPSRENYPNLKAAFSAATQAPQNVILFSLDPQKGCKHNTRNFRFHGWKIIDKARVTNSDNIRTIVSSLGAEPLEINEMKECSFVPHYGIRIESNNSTLDLLVSYICSYMVAYYNDQDYGLFDINSTSKSTIKTAFSKQKLPLPRAIGF